MISIVVYSHNPLSDHRSLFSHRPDCIVHQATIYVGFFVGLRVGFLVGLRVGFLVGDLVVVVVGFNVGFDVTTTSFVGLAVLVEGDRVGIALGGFVGPDSTVSYFTVISCGAAHVPPKYNPRTAPCS